MKRIEHDRVNSPFGAVELFAAEERLLACDFADRRERLLAWLEARFGELALRRRRDPYGFSTRLRGYFAGRLHELDAIAVDPGGSAFQSAVWRALRRVPPGRTAAYGEIARRIGRPRAVRAVGMANARNPIALVIPCHRIIGADGSLSGYGGGLARKRGLLAHEGVACLPS